MSATSKLSEPASLTWVFLPSLFRLNAARFYIQLAKGNDHIQVLDADL
jgi:hypothetical protein